MPRSRTVFLFLLSGLFLAGRLTADTCSKTAATPKTGAASLTSFVPTNANGTGAHATADKALCTWSVQITCTYDCSKCDPAGAADKDGPAVTETVTTTVDTGNLELGGSGKTWVDTKSTAVAKLACEATAPVPTGSPCPQTIPCKESTAGSGKKPDTGIGGGANTLFVFLGLAAIWLAFDGIRRAARPRS